MNSSSILDLTGRTAVITGSTKGIGFAAAAALASAGAQVVLTGRSEASVANAMKRLKPGAQRAPLIRGHAVDLSTEDGCTALVEREPRADVLVNNVGVFGRSDFFSTSDEVWEQFFRVNVLSGVRLARAYLPGMVETGWGRVVFVSSESAFNVPADMIHYGMTKTANVAVASGLAKRMAGTGVTVNAVLPGPTVTEGLEVMLDVEPGADAVAVARDFVRQHRPTSLIRRAATAEEVANLILYVASPQASATTGAALRVDGGVIETLS